MLHPPSLDNIILFLLLKQVSSFWGALHIEGMESITQVGRKIFDLIIEVASGRRTKSERWRYQEFAIALTSVIEKMWKTPCS